ncbi:MAG TPA: hypothetical protein DCK95_11910, partial [Anaerolineaceae bacterium]|nr:hypothetical protein [Anaerolineaceae bacterium]
PEPTTEPTFEPTQIPTDVPLPTELPTVEPTIQPDNQFAWELVVKLDDISRATASQSVNAQADSLVAQQVTAQFSDNQLILSGSRDLDQLRTILYDSAIDGFDFLGGPTEILISLPSDGTPFTLHLESRISTGYSWDFLSSSSNNATLAVDPSFTSYSSEFGIGTPVIQSMLLSPDQSGDMSIALVYQRPFEPASQIKTTISLSLPAANPILDLSDPTPVRVLSASSQEDETLSQESAFDDLDVDVNNMPSSFDWRTQGVVPAVRDQGACGSCWAFGTVGVMESAIKIAGGPMTDLSEQFLVSCNRSGWSCSGGLTAHMYHYDRLANNQTAIGAVLESSKPYLATNSSCPSAYSHPYRLTGWTYISLSQGSLATVEQIKAAILQYGPVTARMIVGPAFQRYSGGVFSTNETYGTYHQIILVGWDDSTQSWILRNSWGPSWGENGYMRIKYNTSRIGEGTSAVVYKDGSVPQATSPVGDTADATPTYKWTPVSGATKYYYELYRGTTKVYAITVNSSACTTSECTSTPSTQLTTSSNYKWRVRAYVNSAWKSFSAYKYFSVVSPVPNPISPIWNILDTTPDFSFSKVYDADQYEIEVYRYPYTSDAKVFSATLAGSSCPSSPCTMYPGKYLDYSTNYYRWRVRAGIDGIWQTFSTYRYFKPINPYPTLLTPSGTIEDTTPTFTWSKVNEATQYNYELYKGSTKVYSITIPSSACGVDSCSSTPATKLASSTSYKWHIRSYIGNTWYAFSDYKFFALDTIPDPISPLADSTDITPTYKWRPISTATKYYYEVYNTYPSTTPKKIYGITVSTSACNATECSSTPATKLTGGDFKWRVRAYVDGVWQTFSSDKGFWVTTIPNPLEPSNGGSTQDSTPTYKWAKIKVATKYYYELYKDTKKIYAIIVQSSACDDHYCYSTPATKLAGNTNYKWRVRSYVEDTWQSFSPYSTFYVNLTPRLINPYSGTIYDQTPTYKWTKVMDATKYYYDVFKYPYTSADRVYSISVPSSVCEGSYCYSTPSTTLQKGAHYRWRARAYIDGAWQTFSTYTTFLVK